MGVKMNNITYEVFQRQLVPNAGVATPCARRGGRGVYLSISKCPDMTLLHVDMGLTKYAGQIRTSLPSQCTLLWTAVN